MSREILIEYENVVEHEGTPYAARAVCEERSNGMWDGWVEFHSVGGSGWIATERETTQPSHETVRYWATGLTHAYLEGALERAIDGPALAGKWDAPLHVGGSPGPRAHTIPQDNTRIATAPAHAVLDPFAVYAEGRDLLSDQLGALHRDQLRNIIRAHGLLTNAAELDLMSDWEMRALILKAADRAASGG